MTEATEGVGTVPSDLGRDESCSCEIACALTDKDFYEQGSKFCHQYSQLTMQIRMFSQQVLLGYSVAAAIFFANLNGPESIPLARNVMIGGGGVLLVFAIVLWLLNHHFSSAFRAIRDMSLIPIEDRYAYDADSGERVEWPWQAHGRLRSRQSWWIAWHAPFVAIVFIALVSMLVGAVL